jgi:hypothetical protein
VSRRKNFPVEIPSGFCRVGGMKRLRRFFIPLLLVGWLVASSPNALSIFSSLIAPVAEDVAQNPAPADNEDHSADNTLANDCAFTNRRLEVRALVQALPCNLAVRAKPLSPALDRISTAACALPRSWQFVLRAAASPRAPSLLA